MNAIGNDIVVISPGETTVKLIRHSLPLLALMLAAGTATAHEAGDWIFRMGATTVEPRESSDALRLNGSTLLLGGNPSGVGVDASTQFGLTVDYMLTDSWSVELLAATPFKHDLFATGALTGLHLAEAKQLPPTLSLVYHFPQTAGLQPYAGAGINYTKFFQDNLTPAANTALSGLGLRNGNIHLDHSVSYALEGGLDYHVGRNWLLNAAVRWIDIATTASIAFDAGKTLEVDVDVDPLVYTLAVGLSF